MTQHVLKIVTRLQDNGDGGYTMYGYNSNAELLADHPKARRGTLTEDQKEAILSEDDPYNNGYIGQETIVIEIGDDGIARLGKPLHLHAGQ